MAEKREKQEEAQDVQGHAKRSEPERLDPTATDEGAAHGDEVETHGYRVPGSPPEPPEKR